MKDPEGVFWLSRKKAESAPENCCNREREQKKNQRDNAQTGRNRVKSKKKDQLKQARRHPADTGQTVNFGPVGRFLMKPEKADRDDGICRTVIETGADQHHEQGSEKCQKENCLKGLARGMQHPKCGQRNEKQGNAVTPQKQDGLGRHPLRFLMNPELDMADQIQHKDKPGNGIYQHGARYGIIIAVRPDQPGFDKRRNRIPEAEPEQHRAQTCKRGGKHKDQSFFITDVLAENMGGVSLTICSQPISCFSVVVFRSHARIIQ